MSLHDKPNINLHEEELVWGLEGANSEFTFFDFSQVSDATSAFSDENKLGQGGFGPVYKVKKLMHASYVASISHQ